MNLREFLYYVAAKIKIQEFVEHVGTRLVVIWAQVVTQKLKERGTKGLIKWQLSSLGKINPRTVH